MRKLKCFIPTSHYAKEAVTASSITLNMAVAQFWETLHASRDTTRK